MTHGLSPLPRHDASTLRDKVAGPVLHPGEPGWDVEIAGFNLAVTQRPDVVVGATCTADVVHAVCFAGERGWTVAVQATGHGAAVPADGGLLVNTSRMNALHIDAGNATARVGAGVRWQQMIDAAAPHGLAPLNGSSTDVGAVGYMLGGGMGPMGRTFGFAADHVIELELVTARGETLRVTAGSDPELFWALRGGKCSLGIVTEIEFALMPVASYYGGAIYFPGADAAAVLHAYREWVQTVPDEVTSSIALLRLPDLPELPPPLRGTLTAHLRYVHVGDPGRGEQLLAPLRPVARPLVDDVDKHPYTDIGAVHNDPHDPLPAWDAGRLLTGFPAAAVDALLATAGPAVDVPLILAEIRHLGGALGRQPAIPNATGGREAAFSAYVVGPLPPPLAEATPAAGSAVLQALSPWQSGYVQANLRGLTSDQRPAWAPDVAERLAAITARHDPDGMFTFAHPASP